VIWLAARFAPDSTKECPPGHRRNMGLVGENGQAQNLPHNGPRRNNYANLIYGAGLRSWISPAFI
jgi:hypothetical protein